MPASGESVVARLTTDRATAEQVFAMLGESLDPGKTALSMFEAAPGPTPETWTVACYCSDSVDPSALRSLVAAAAGSEAAGALRFESLAERDWVAASLAGLGPVAAGRFVVHGAHDRSNVPANRIGIEVAAALAFGTGHHGTTRGCLLAFDDLMKRHRPRRVLDVGTGTGVLAIAAALALRRRVLASDIDGPAVRTARANARRNRAGTLVEILWANGVNARRLHDAGRYDLVFANILLEPLKALARPLGGMLARHGRIVISGLLPGQANAARAAYRTQGLSLERLWLVDGWATLVLRHDGFAGPEKSAPRPASGRPGR